MANKKDEIIEEAEPTSKDQQTKEEPKASKNESKDGGVIYSLSGVTSKKSNKAIHSL